MKTSRRDFLAAASLTAAYVPVSWPAQTMLHSSTLSSEHVTPGHPLTLVFDEHLADSRAFAVRSRTTGARIVPLGNDIGMLWFERLMPLASVPGNTIMGLTTHASAFLLTRFAQSIGLRVAQRTAGAHVKPDTLVMWQLVADGARTSSCSVKES